MGRRKKRRTHARLQEEGVAEVGDEAERIPRALVFGRGKLPGVMSELVRNLRMVFAPNTAERLRERRSNTLKDFVSVAGPLGVTHFVILTSSDVGSYCRLVRVPSGPTITFRIEQYTLARDIVSNMPGPSATSRSLFRKSPLIVLNSLGGDEPQLKLASKMLQGMFPPIDVNLLKVEDVKRVVLFALNSDTGFIELRHYGIRLAHTGLSKAVKRLVKQHRVPDLGAYDDVSEYFLKSSGAAESDAESESVQCSLPSASEGQRTTVRLCEIGPRLQLRLMKVEEGISEGAVLFHAFVQKTPEELAELARNRSRLEAQRAQRKAEQEANVRRKAIARAERAEAQRQQALERGKASAKRAVQREEDRGEVDSGEARLRFGSATGKRSRAAADSQSAPSAKRRKKEQRG